MANVFPPESRNSSKLISIFIVILFQSWQVTAQQPFYISHWASGNDPNLSTGTAGTVSNIVIDSVCSQVKISIADPIAAPLPAFNAYELNPLDNMGNEITDLSGNMRVYVRARSLESVRLAILLRSGGGSSTERSDRVEFTIPGDTSTWNEFLFEFNAANLAGFDSTNFRDIWFYLDRGTDNFAGNAFYLDYVAIGSAPDSALNSTCISDSIVGNDSTLAIQYTLHWANSNDEIFTGSSAATLTQTVDTLCSQIKISVTDPVNAPLSAFNALIINPKDSMGADISDISGSARFFARVRSKDSVRLGFVARSGDGTTPFRSILQQQVIPGDTTNWTEVSFAFDSATIGGFDSTDLRDLWFFLDQGTENFAGNEFYFDYVAMGEKPDPAENSACTFFPPFEFPYVLHWADTLEGVFGGTGAAQLTQTIDTLCSQLAVSVTDTLGDPHAAFRPLIINPQDEFGNDISDVSGQMRFYTRVRSKRPVLLGMVLRSGEGTATERTAVVEQSVPGDLSQWTELVYTFTGTDYAGFDSTDLRDFWFYLDREVPNFNGNEFYFDYVSIGGKPDTNDNSACIQSVGLENKFTYIPLNLYPNPGAGNQATELAFYSAQQDQFYLQIYDIRGQLLWQDSFLRNAGVQTYTIQPQHWASGLYTIQLISNHQKGWTKWMIK
ncbi:MAG: T9SS type A sorting domain-containing protein [Bacteroidia bacterium]